MEIFVHWLKLGSNRKRSFKQILGYLKAESEFCCYQLRRSMLVSPVLVVCIAIILLSLFLVSNGYTSLISLNTRGFEAMKLFLHISFLIVRNKNVLRKLMYIVNKIRYKLWLKRSNWLTDTGAYLQNILSYLCKHHQNDQKEMEFSA